MRHTPVFLVAAAVILSARSAAGCADAAPPFEVRVGGADFVGEVTIVGEREETYPGEAGREVCVRVCHAEVLEPIEGDRRRLSFVADACPAAVARRTFLLVGSSLALDAEARGRMERAVEEQKAGPYRDRLLCRIRADADFAADLVPFEEEDVDVPLSRRRWLRADGILASSIRAFGVETLVAGGEPVDVVAWDDVLAAIREQVGGAPVP